MSRRGFGGLAELSQEARDALFVGDDRDELQPAEAHVALEDVDRERAFEELGPRAIAGASALLDVVARGDGVRGRERLIDGLRHDARTHLAVGSEYAGITHGVKPRRGDGGRQSAEERQRIHVDGDGAVRERLLERDADEPVGTVGDTLLGDGRPQHVLEEGLAAVGVEGACADRCVQSAPIERGAKRLVEAELGAHERQRASSPFGAGWRRLATRGRRGELGEAVGAVRVVGVVVVAVVVVVGAPSRCACRRARGHRRRRAW